MLKNYSFFVDDFIFLLQKYKRLSLVGEKKTLFNTLVNISTIIIT